ncbi:MAG: hypothetical protein U0V48_15500 [Anaerolineales bacterium]
MKRVLRKDGTIILFESLGTGNESPIQLEHVESTYRWLDANGFQGVLDLHRLQILNRRRKPKSYRAFSSAMSWGRKSQAERMDRPA